MKINQRVETGVSSANFYIGYNDENENFHIMDKSRNYQSFFLPISQLPELLEAIELLRSEVEDGK